jgi:pimeloyl-ACP methyl ester carboxylesterase
MYSLKVKAEIAQDAYKQSGETDGQWANRIVDKYWSKEQGREVYPVGYGPTAFFVLVQNKHAVITFRGTELDDIQDLIADLKVKPVPNFKGPGKVHEGVQEALKSVWPQITTLIQELEVNSVELVGHSLGGMLATLCAMWLYIDCENIAITGVTTFGSPPIGDKEFAAALRHKLGENLCDVVNSVDIVPRLITPRIMGYKRAGNVYYMPEGGGDPQSGQYLSMLIADLISVYGQWYLRWKSTRQFSAPGIERHSISRYRERLEEIQT